MKRTMAALAAAMIATLPSARAMATPPPPPAMPDPARCPATAPIDPEMNGRKGPLPVPAAMRAVIRSSQTNLAVWTLGNATFCYPIDNVGEARNFAMSADSRFVEFDWFGYEEGGHIVIDRTGAGQAVDTGAKPMFSPSRRQMAAIEWSESGFGSLNGFAVWQVLATGLRRTALIEAIPSLVDWRIDGWAGETCISLSGIPPSRVPEATEDFGKVARDRYVARPVGGSWRIVRATGRGCAAR